MPRAGIGSLSVRVVIAGPNGECEPLFERTVELDSPLGDRHVVDTTTRDEVPSSLG